MSIWNTGCSCLMRAPGSRARAPPNSQGFWILFENLQVSRIQRREGSPPPPPLMGPARSAGPQPPARGGPRQALDSGHLEIFKQNKKNKKKNWAGLPRGLKKTGKLGHFRSKWRKKTSIGPPGIWIYWRENWKTEEIQGGGGFFFAPPVRYIHPHLLC